MKFNTLNEHDTEAKERLHIEIVYNGEFKERLDELFHKNEELNPEQAKETEQDPSETTKRENISRIYDNTGPRIP